MRLTGLSSPTGSGVSLGLGGRTAPVRWPIRSNHDETGGLPGMYGRAAAGVA
jgi:hypothetical protein